MIAGAIIAGGLSSRMQEGGVAGDKFLQPLNGERSIIAHVITRISPQVETLVVNANSDDPRLANLGVPILKDLPSKHGGPLVGILSALIHARGASLLLTTAADTPFLPRDLAGRLLSRRNESGARIVLASSLDRVHPIFGLWETGLADELSAWLSETNRASVLAFAEHIGFETVDFPLAFAGDSPETYDPFFNINRPDDLVAARKLAESME
ncbi:molybdenum cofactor guanylyltransferase [Brucella intermedia]|nr:molybdenum cofactor guanylyltransferase [Brucella intermedia]PJT26910.1 molybdenum cofactor guanylyltransferase [Ochrobactrum sp. 30A/1000/2015]PJT38330.1 molybdenum cofactor guanylyltransferase [Ochrobactrum sp. 27A/999/2015]PJT44349.1 molybdenum cofactor guanylyltransferase [Ochrobactrum sp. 23A/997/2015]KAB2714366.1 molybdenum cofactor guanylyltransferase [Brucella intermedia]MDL2203316.1 molybdenum cofactor guanylyltransferase [Brucella intermedia]